MSGGLKPQVMKGCSNDISDSDGAGDLTETMEMDWSNSPQASRQHSTTSLNLKPRGQKAKLVDRETRCAAIWKQTSKKWDVVGDNWSDWLRRD